MHLYNSTRYCKTETVFSIFPFLQTNITSQMWPCGGKGGGAYNCKSAKYISIFMCIQILFECKSTERNLIKPESLIHSLNLPHLPKAASTKPLMAYQAQAVTIYIEKSRCFRFQLSWTMCFEAVYCITFHSHNSQTMNSICLLLCCWKQMFGYQPWFYLK